MFSDKQIHVDLDTIVSFVIQSGQVSEVGQSPCFVMLTTVNGFLLGNVN